MEYEQSSKQYLKLVKSASTGGYRLPEFQRESKWKIRQNILLFDSLRSGFPIGSFLLSGKGSFNYHKPFKYAKGTSQKQPEFVLDGQQRITAGMQLFFGDSDEQKTHYFIDLEKLENSLSQWLEAESKNIESKSDIEEFAKQLEAEEHGYITGKTNIKNPRDKFVSNRSVSTTLLISEHQQEYQRLKPEYLLKHPGDKRLIEIFEQIFIYNISYDPIVPITVINSSDNKVLSRIFSTLNNTGISLTPFEITVSEMYAQDIRLLEEIGELTARIPNYHFLDPDKTILLQTVLYLGGNDHKKSNLPRQLNKVKWDDKKEAAVSALLQARQSILDLGCPIDISKKYIPYDSAILPIANLCARFDLDKLNPQDTRFIQDLVMFFFYSAAFQTRYTEGAHTKQKTDAGNLVSAFEKRDKSLIVRGFDRGFSGLANASASSAIGKAVWCMFNSEGLKDPLANTAFKLGEENVEVHHFFPRKKLKELNLETKQINRLGNLVLTLTDTNSSFLNDAPCEQISRCKQENAGAYEEAFKRQCIDEECLQFIINSELTRETYEVFIELREKKIEERIFKKFTIEKAQAGQLEANLDDDSD